MKNTCRRKVTTNEKKNKGSGYRAPTEVTSEQLPHEEERVKKGENCFFKCVGQL